MFRRAILLVLFFLSCAKSQATTPELSPTIYARPPAVLVAEQAPDAEPDDDGGPIPVPAGSASSETIRALFRPAAEPVQRCVAGKSGKVTVRVTQRDGMLHAELEPSASLDPTARACVLDALSTVWLEATGSNVGGPSVPPTGFVSLVTVTW